MTRIVFVIAVASTLSIGSAPAAQEATGELLIYGASDENLARAREEIGRMGESQLRSLLAYLAECRERSNAPAAMQACSSARSRYQIEFGGARNSAVDAAIDVAEQYLKISWTISCCRVPPGTAKIDAALQEAARVSFQRLR